MRELLIQCITKCHFTIFTRFYNTNYRPNGKVLNHLPMHVGSDKQYFFCNIFFYHGEEAALFARMDVSDQYNNVNSIKKQQQQYAIAVVVGNGAVVAVVYVLIPFVIGVLVRSLSKTKCVYVLIWRSKECVCSSFCIASHTAITTAHTHTGSSYYFSIYYPLRSIFFKTMG